MYFSSIYPDLEEIHRSVVWFIFPEHGVSHFITMYLAVKRMPFLLQQPDILTRALVICTRTSRVIDWPFSTICLGFKKCLAPEAEKEQTYCERGVQCNGQVNNGHFY